MNPTGWNRCDPPRPALEARGSSAYREVRQDQGSPAENRVVENVMRKHSESDVFRITGARTGLQEDVRARQRRYVISMGIRTVAVILTVVLWHVALPVAVATLAVGLLLPYIAVVVANGGRENATDLPSTFVPMPTRPMISAPAAPASPNGRAGREDDRDRPHTESRTGAAAGGQDGSGEGQDADPAAGKR